MPGTPIIVVRRSIKRSTPQSMFTSLVQREFLPQLKRRRLLGTETDKATAFDLRRRSQSGHGVRYKPVY